MGAAFLAGALAALAMPPLYWLPLAVLGIVAFVWLWQTAPGPRSALLRRMFISLRDINWSGAANTNTSSARQNG